MRNYSKFNFTPAFTLAEVLVTLGIIGVVSAMTVPTLMQNHQRKVFVTQLHKVYNEFQQAATAQIAERNAINLAESGVRSDTAMKTFLKNQFNVVKDCTGTPSKCLASSYLNMNGGAVTSYSDTSAPCLALADGAVICAKYSVSKEYKDPVKNELGQVVPGPKEKDTNYISGLIGDLVIDVNGQQGPNIVGRDLFIAGIFNDGSIASAKPGKKLLNSATEEKDTATNLQKCQRATGIARQTDASYCFDEILSSNWVMEY